MNNQNRRVLLIVFISGFVVISGLFAFLNLENETYRSNAGVEIQIIPTNYPDPQISRVSVAETKKYLDRSEAVIVDVRSSGSYALSHIPGAVSVPVLSTNFSFDAPKDALIFLYCA